MRTTYQTLKITILRTKKLTEGTLSQGTPIVTTTKDKMVKSNITFVRSLLKFLKNRSTSKNQKNEKIPQFFFKKGSSQDTIKLKIDETDLKFHQIAHRFFIKRMSLHDFYNWKISKFKSIANQLKRIENKKEPLHFDRGVENLSKEVESFEPTYKNYNSEEYCRITRITDYFAK